MWLYWYVHCYKTKQQPLHEGRKSQAFTLIEALILGLCPPLICMKKSQEKTYTSNLYNELSVENHALLRTFQSELNYEPTLFKGKKLKKY